MGHAAPRPAHPDSIPASGYLDSLGSPGRSSRRWAEWGGPLLAVVAGAGIAGLLAYAPYLLAPIAVLLLIAVAALGMTRNPDAVLARLRRRPCDPLAPTGAHGGIDPGFSIDGLSATNVAVWYGNAFRAYMADDDIDAAGRVARFEAALDHLIARRGPIGSEDGVPIVGKFRLNRTGGFAPIDDPRTRLAEERLRSQYLLGPTFGYANDPPKRPPPFITELRP